MANFIPRNVLMCVLPAVILFFSVYWFKKKKKIKPDILSDINTNALTSEKSEVDSKGSPYSSVECNSDFSNTLSDASSISSPEHCKQTSVYTSNIDENTSLSNHVNNFCEEKAIEKEINCISKRDVIPNCEKLFSMAHINKTECVNHENIKSVNVNSVHPKVTENHIICNTSEEELDDYENIIAQTVVSSESSYKILEFNENNSNLNSAEPNSTELITIDNSSISSTVIEDMSKECKSVDIDSHSSVLDENSLSSTSDELDRNIDYKRKDSPSSVFEGNSICDESESTDLSHNGNSSLDISKENEESVEVLSSIIPENFSINLVQSCSDTSEEKILEESNVTQNIDSLQQNSSFSTSIESEVTCLKTNSVQSLETDFNESSTLSSTMVASDTDLSSLKDNVISNSSCKVLISDNLGSQFTLDSLHYNNVEHSVSASNSLLCEKDCLVSNELDSSLLTPIVQKNAKLSEISEETLDSQLKVHNQTKDNDFEIMDMKLPVSNAPGHFVYEFDLPQELCGHLIGRQGKHVRSIKERTNANVLIKRHPFDSNLKAVVVEGSRSAVYEALDIIRRKFPPSQFPAVTLVQTNWPISHGVSLPESLQLHLPEGASCDVILSSLVSAGHFFLQQPTHPTYPSLSTLDQCMITCYSQMDTPLLPHPVEAGVICAAPVMNGWFRAQVIYVHENRNECDIKFVDYGGFSTVSISSLRQIRSDFMTLPFQASECYLANVRPVDQNGWSAEATAVFEELAQGQILQALLVEYAEDGMPCVNLYKVQGASSVFINQELVDRGFAVWVDSLWDPH